MITKPSYIENKIPNNCTNITFHHYLCVMKLGPANKDDKNKYFTNKLRFKQNKT